jgi:signal transduction histidine kinase
VEHIPISDDILIEELQKRLSDNRKALNDLKVLNKKMAALNTKLADSEAVKGNFLSNIRNEINNPLASIMGISKQLACGKTDLETTQRMAQTILNEAFDLDFQLRNIFTAAELEAGEATMDVSRVDIDSLVRNLLDSYNHRAAEKKLTIDMAWNVAQKAAEPVYFNTDSEKLEIILSNLLSNAIEFNKEGKKIKITIIREEHRLIVSIEDEGIGISAEQREKLFIRFGQLDTGSRKIHRGHGLGLSITKALAEMLDGKIAFATAAGGGCIFTISINEAGSGVQTETLSEEGNEFLF